MTVDELDALLGRIARTGGRLDFGLRMLWFQLNDISAASEIPLDVAARVDGMVQRLNGLGGMTEDKRGWATDCLIDVRVGLLDRTDALEYMWIHPIQPATTWHQQRNGVPDDRNHVDVIERTKPELDDLADRLDRLNVRATMLGFAMWEFIGPMDPLAALIDDQWAIVRDEFDMNPDGGYQVRK